MLKIYGLWSWPHPLSSMYDNDLLVTAVHVKLLKRRMLTYDFYIIFLLIGAYFSSLLQKMHNQECTQTNIWSIKGGRAPKSSNNSREGAGPI